jgi:hypothetical protein
MRAASLACLSAALAVTLAACRSPTQIEVPVTTDIPCAEVTGTSFTPGQLGAIETRPLATMSTTCTDGYLGTVVMVPSGDDGADVAFKVVTSFDGTSVDQCTADGGYAGNCIVARRALRYLPHTTLTVPVRMSRVCAGNDCGDPTMTCVEGQCVPATIPDPSQCEGSGCGEQTLLPPGAEDAGSTMDATVQDASGTDAGPHVDAGGADAAMDSAAPPFDAGPLDGSVPGCDLGGLLAGSPWPMNGYCPARRARSPIVGPPKPLHSWVQPLGEAAGFLWSAPVLGADGTVFVTAGNDYVAAFTPDGTPLWEHALPGTPGGLLEIAPALAADHTLRVIDFNAALYFVVPIDGGTATATPLPGGQAGEGELTIVSGGASYFGDQDGYIDAVTAGAQTIWRTPASSNESDYIGVNAAGAIFSGYSGAGAYLAEVSPDGGALVWSSGTIGGDRLTQVSVAVDQTVRAASYSNVYSFDPSRAEDAGLVWVRGLAQNEGIAVSDDGWTYATTGSGPPDGGPSGVYGYDPTGATVVAAAGENCSAPIVDAAQNVYAFCDGTVAAFSPHLAAPLWSVDLGTTFPAYAGMMLDDTVVLGQNGDVYFTANAPLPDGGTTPIVCALTP